jgi:DNA-binding Lrp family transcriptional regulator
VIKISSELIILGNVLINTELQNNMDFREVSDRSERSAFVFITAESDSTNRALEDLRKIHEVSEVYLAKGAYDLIAKVRGDSVNFLIESVLKEIKKLSSVKSTLTLTVI